MAVGHMDWVKKQTKKNSDSEPEDKLQVASL